MEVVYEYPIDCGIDNVGLAVHANLLVVTTPILHAITLHALSERVAINIMASDALDTAPDAIRGPTRVAAYTHDDGSTRLLCAEYGNRWARLVAIDPDDCGASGATVLHAFTAGSGVGVFAVAAAYGKLIVCGRSEDPDTAATPRVWVYDAATYALIASGAAPATHGAHWNSILSCQLTAPNTALFALRGYSAPVELDVTTWTVRTLSLVPPLLPSAQISAVARHGSSIFITDVAQQALLVYAADELRADAADVLVHRVGCENPVDLCVQDGVAYVLNAKTNDARVQGFVAADLTA